MHAIWQGAALAGIRRWHVRPIAALLHGCRCLARMYIRLRRSLLEISAICIRSRVADRAMDASSWPRRAAALQPSMQSCDLCAVHALRHTQLLHLLT